MKLISYKLLENNMYAIKFNSTQCFSHFDDFAYLIGQINAKFNVKDGSWLIRNEDFQLFQELDLRLYPPKTQLIKTTTNSLIKANKKTVSNYNSIGATMKITPYEYQKRVIKFMLDTKHCLIVSPCGSGKTPMGVGLFVEARKQHKISNNAKGLIIVKASLKKQWCSEVEKFSNYTSSIINSYKSFSKNKRDILFENQFNDNVDLFITNYETLKDAKVSDKLLNAMNIEFVFADEIHYAKGDTTDRAKALYKFNDILFRVGATATPVQKDPRDLFGIYKFIKPDLFPKKNMFNKTYIKWGGFGRPIGSLNEADLNRKIEPYSIVITKEEVSKQLPKLTVIQRYCEFNSVQLEMNNKLMTELDELHQQEEALKSTLSEAEAKTNKDLIKIETGIMMRQTFAQELADSEELLKLSESKSAEKYITNQADNKIALLIDLIDEILSSGEKVCVFSKFATMQDIISRRIEKEARKSGSIFKNINIAYVNGTLNSNQRFDEVYNKFRDTDNYKVLLMSDAGAEGINLSNCKYMIEVDLADSYAIQVQRHGRLERADSVHDNVFVYQLIMKESWDEIAQKIINKKKNYDDTIIKGLDR